MSSYKLEKSSLTNKHVVSLSVPGICFTIAHLTVFLFFVGRIYILSLQNSTLKGTEVSNYTQYFNRIFFTVSTIILLVNVLCRRSKLVELGRLLDRLDTINTEMNKKKIYRKQALAVLSITSFFSCALTLSVICMFMNVKQFSYERLIVVMLPHIYAVVEMLQMFSYNYLVYSYAQEINQMMMTVQENECF